MLVDKEITNLHHAKNCHKTLISGLPGEQDVYKVTIAIQALHFDTCPCQVIKDEDLRHCSCPCSRCRGQARLRGLPRIRRQQLRQPMVIHHQPRPSYGQGGCRGQNSL